jgi:hypothetical protein
LAKGPGGHHKVVWHATIINDGLNLPGKLLFIV